MPPRKAPLAQGLRVSARASVIMNPVWAETNFEGEEVDERRIVYGTLKTCTGRGAEMKWLVKWDSPVLAGECNTSYTASVLRRESTAAGLDASTAAEEDDAMFAADEHEDAADGDQHAEPDLHDADVADAVGVGEGGSASDGPGSEIFETTVLDKLLDVDHWTSTGGALSSNKKRMDEAKVVFPKLASTSAKVWKNLLPEVKAEIKRVGKMSASRRPPHAITADSSTRAHMVVQHGRAAAAAAAAAAKAAAAAEKAAPAEWEEGRVEVEMTIDAKDKLRVEQLGTDKVVWYSDDLDNGANPVNLGHVPAGDDPELADDDTAEMDPFELFVAHYPGGDMAAKRHVKKLNEEGSKSVPEWTKVTMCDYWKFFGIFLGASLRAERGAALFTRDKGQGQAEPGNMWSVHSSGPGPEYSRVMPEAKFERMKTNMWRIWFQPGDDWYVGKLFREFNVHVQRLVKGGSYFVVDEFMSSFRPRNSKTGGLPHLSYISRKPEPLGTEFKNITNSLGMQLFAELQESGDKMREKKHRREVGYAGGACLARLVEGANLKPGSVIIGDAGFGSVIAAAYLAAKFGVYCTLNVKGAHLIFPRVWLEEKMKNHRAGTTLVLQTEIKFEGVSVKMMAIGYRYSKSKKAQFFVSTYGSTAGGTPYSCRYRDPNGTPCIKPVFRPLVLCKYWELSNKIDVFNMVRQGQLRLEKTWVVTNPHTRLITTVFGNIHINTLYARNISTGEQMSQRQFTASTSAALCAGGSAGAEEEDDGEVYRNGACLQHEPREVAVVHKRTATSINKYPTLECAVCRRLFGKASSTRIRCMQCNHGFCRKRLCWDHHVQVGHAPEDSDDVAWADVKSAGLGALEIQ